MHHYKPVVALFVLLCTGMVRYAYAQAPVIVPKPQPVVLHLDATGYYKVNPFDIATITNPTDAPTGFDIKPVSFDCSTTGPQVVNLKVFDNGLNTPPSPNNAAFTTPIGIAFDSHGNMFVSEDGARIRKITPKGVTSIFVGGAERGHQDGVGTNALLGSPLGMAIDSEDNLFLIDAGFPGVGSAPCIRKVTPQGVVTTIDFGKYFHTPWAIAIDKQNIMYVSDPGNNAVFRVQPNGDAVVMAGIGNAGHVDGDKQRAELSGPTGIAVDDAGNVYVTENAYFDVRKITPDGTVSTFAGTGHSKSPGDPPDVNTFGDPFGVGVDKTGYIYVCDYQNIVRISPDGTNKEFIVADEARMTGGLITFDECGNIYVADSDKNKIDKASTAGVFSIIAGSGSQATVDGNVGPFSCQIAEEAINVQVESQPSITSIFKDITLTDCTTLADYTAKAGVTDNCPNSIVKVTQTPAPDIQLENNTSVKVTVTATDNTGGTTSKSFNASTKYVGSPPGRSVSVSASATKICAGEPVTFTADVINGDPGTSFQWLINNQPAGPDNPVFTTSDIKDGDVVNCAVTTGGGCGIPNTGLDVTVSVGPYPTITLKPTEQILSGNSVQFNPTFTGNIVSYSWTPATALSDPTSPNPTASPIVTTTYQLKATTDIGCEAVASVTVMVVNKITVPNTFTPNGDRTNDSWEIPFLSNYTRCVVNVYNRYGALAFHSTGYGIPWDGTSNGKPVPAGAYYYIIDLKDGSQPKAGELTVLR